MLGPRSRCPFPPLSQHGSQGLGKPTHSSRRASAAYSPTTSGYHSLSLALSCSATTLQGSPDFYPPLSQRNLRDFIHGRGGSSKRVVVGNSVRPVSPLIYFSVIATCSRSSGVAVSDRHDRRPPLGSHTLTSGTFIGPAARQSSDSARVTQQLTGWYLRDSIFWLAARGSDRDFERNKVGGPAPDDRQFVYILSTANNADSSRSTPSDPPRLSCRHPWYLRTHTSAERTTSRCIRGNQVRPRALQNPLRSPRIHR